MKTEFKKNYKMFSLNKAFNDLVITDAMVSLNNSIELFALFKKIGWRVISACFTKKVKLSHRVQTLNLLCQHLLRIRRIHGDVYAVKYLKACVIAIQKKIGQSPFKSLRELEKDLPLPRLSKSGLPRFIPLRDRRSICSGNKDIIRFYLTIFSVYRIIKIPGVLKVSTITDPYSGSLEALSVVSNDLKILSLKILRRFDKSLLLKEFRFLPLEKASPNSRSS
jgi:hypothetical protein